MSNKRLSLVEVLLIILIAFIPLFISLPYRINIFLSWEGAYRISNGQLPFRDFGTPIGGAFWMVPALFFKIFGPQMISLVKAQVLMNIVAGLAFRSILKKIGIDPIARFISILVFIFSYSFVNFWPWYNHTVIVYELIALYFLLNHIYNIQNWLRNVNLLFAGLFTALSFLTKQDAGGLTIVLCLALLFYTAITEKKWLSLLYYIGSLAIFIALYVLITDPSGFAYWFNHGQAPHSSRVHISDLLEEFFSGSQWIKFYMLMIIILSVEYLGNFKKSFSDKRIMIPILLVFGILAEAVIFSVTSYIPPDNNIFFHSFAIAYILNRVIVLNISSHRRKLFFISAVILVMIWWSPNYWRYMQRFMPVKQQQASGEENVVDRNTYKIDSVDMGVPMHEWIEPGLFTVKKITLPAPTNEGIKRLMNMPLIKQNKELKVLNMTELTTLAAEIPYSLEKSNQYPLWFHLGVGMFNKQADMFENRIATNYYDLVLFEYIPSLNNFYPFRTRNKLKQYYYQTDSFPAPRRGETQGIIEVYIRKQNGTN